jgi:hypothetical protein
MVGVALEKTLSPALGASPRNVTAVRLLQLWKAASSAGANLVFGEAGVAFGEKVERLSLCKDKTCIAKGTVQIDTIKSPRGHRHMRTFLYFFLTLCISVTHARAADLNRLKEADNDVYFVIGPQGEESPARSGAGRR